MRSSRVIRAGSVTVILALTFLMSACAPESDGASAPPANATADALADAPVDTPSDAPAEDALDVIGEALEGPEGKDQRVFEASDDDVITVVEATLRSQNAKARWDGSVLRVEVDGSVEDVTASSPCLMLKAFLTDGEETVLSYGDGEVDCSEW